MHVIAELANVIPGATPGRGIGRSPLCAGHSRTTLASANLLATPHFAKSRDVVASFGESRAPRGQQVVKPGTKPQPMIPGMAGSCGTSCVYRAKHACFGVESGPDQKEKVCVSKDGMPKDSTVRSPPQTWTSACLSPLFAPESQTVASNDSIVGLAPAIGGFKEAESQTRSPDSCRHPGRPCDRLLAKATVGCRGG